MSQRLQNLIILLVSSIQLPVRCGSFGCFSRLRGAGASAGAAVLCRRCAVEKQSHGSARSGVLRPRERGATADQTASISRRDGESGSNGRFVGCAERKAGVVGLLAEAGCNLDLKDKDGKSARCELTQQGDGSSGSHLCNCGEAQL
jgi:hypothetical protein